MIIGATQPTIEGGWRGDGTIERGSGKGIKQRRMGRRGNSRGGGLFVEGNEMEGE